MARKADLPSPARRYNPAARRSRGRDESRLSVLGTATVDRIPPARLIQQAQRRRERGEPRMVKSLLFHRRLAACLVIGRGYALYGLCGAPLHPAN